MDPTTTSINTLTDYRFIREKNSLRNNTLLCVKTDILTGDLFLSTVAKSKVTCWTRFLLIFNFGPLAKENVKFVKMKDLGEFVGKLFQKQYGETNKSMPVPLFYAMNRFNAALNSAEQPTIPCRRYEPSLDAQKGYLNGLLFSNPSEWRRLTGM